MKKIILFLALVSLSLGASQAAITMTVNTTAETISFSGSDTGNAEEFEMMPYAVRFWTDPGSGTTSSTQDLIITSCFETIPGLDVVWFTSRIGDDPTAEYLDIVASGGADITSVVAKPSVTVSYATWGSGHKVLLESFIGGSMVLAPLGGSGYSDIQIVPEPSSFLLLLGAAAAVLCFRRRLR
jgi:hypothetical protein